MAFLGYQKLAPGSEMPLRWDKEETGLKELTQDREKNVNEIDEKRRNVKRKI